MVRFTDLSVHALAACLMSSAQARVDHVANGLNARQTDMAAAYSLPPLGYAYDALEPYFDKETMEIHYTKHHQTYVNNLNNLLKDNELSTLAVDDLVIRLAEVQDQIPSVNRTGVRNNAGGHSNHSFFWKQLKLNTTLEGDLKEAIDKNFGSFEEFQKQFEKAATSVFGSGWAWLVHQEDGTLKVVSTANQDSPLMGKQIAGAEGTPIIGLDVWEHAYYLKYQNRRPDYIKAYWSVVNWEFAGQRYSEVKKC
ncbi:hypothetical protein CKM354_000288000 [Cercospora kikuchii]|uniref:Superoxide dismutase n=1 Tax=Cercospora kikuchii TaxID=84275 RepID=A0A9P3FA17_9PEZI|nr:uncharacterized protein CKM354_000288000 [Cercospora kikuchii]GIZ39498.1 hypothetical protein CKM354_000288000 [Cercospora kikuchii]